MKEPITPQKIQKEFSTGVLSKENAAELLISLVERSDSTFVRVESIKVLENIKFHTEKVFKFLENCLVSDEDAVVRATVIDFIINNFLEFGLPALSWSIKHEKSPLPLRVLINSRDNFNSPQLERDIIEWNENFASKLGVVPAESIFFLDLEALFAEDKRKYELDPLSYKHFETLSDIKNGEPWLVIRNKHVEILNFEFFKWKFIKNNTDIINSLLKLQDLDVYLCSLRRYSNEKVMSSGIPDSLGTLTYLKKLIIRRNGLKQLPSSMKNLTLLQELDISYNKFDEFPKILSTLNKLELLNIKYNIIKNIPTDLSRKLKVIR